MKFTSNDYNFDYVHVFSFSAREQLLVFLLTYKITFCGQLERKADV